MGLGCFLSKLFLRGYISISVSLHTRVWRRPAFTLGITPLRIKRYSVSLLMPNMEYASGTVMYSWSFGIALAIASKRSFLFSSSFLRLNATLEHLGEQYQDVIVFATNGSPQILHFLVISNFATPIQFYYYLCLLSVTLSTNKCWYKYGAKIKQISEYNERNTKFN